MEAWHHCPRSQAVAAALSTGAPSMQLMAGQKDVFLGSGTCSLLPLLTKPQVRPVTVIGHYCEWNM